MSTLISLLVVGGAGAVVLWITVGDFGQPATKDPGTAGGDDIESNDGTPHLFDQDEVVAVAATVAPATVTPDEKPAHAARPAEGTVPQAAPSRPAEPAAVDRPPARSRRTVTLRGSYSFVPAPPITWARRVRSALGVVLVVTAVGLALAASVGVLVVLVSRSLEGAVN